MKYLLLALFLISCGDDESRVITSEQIPPIPPIVRREPLPPINPDTKVSKKPSHDEYFYQAKLRYPHIQFAWIYGNNAKTEMIGYRRYRVSMGIDLKRTVDAEQFALILNHEVQHCFSGNSEVKADFGSIARLRYMLRYSRQRYDNQYLDRIAYRNYRWLRTKPRGRRHPSPEKRLRIYRKAIRKQKLKRSDYY